MAYWHFYSFGGLLIVPKYLTVDCVLCHIYLFEAVSLFLEFKYIKSQIHKISLASLDLFFEKNI